MATNNQQIGIVCPVPMGEWQANAMYKKLNIVSYNGTTYIAKKDNNNFAPEITNGWQEVWMPIANKGGTGDTGVTPNISMSATVGNTVGTPSVTVTKGGSPENPTFIFNFNNLKGQTGATGASSINSALVENVDGDSEVNTFAQKYIKGAAQAKNYYNLGAFDAYASNGDGTGRILRKTGYLKLVPDMEYRLISQNPAGLSYIIFDPPGAVSNLDGRYVANRGIKRDCWHTTAYPNKGECYINPEGYSIQAMGSSEDLSTLWELNIIIQYELTYGYIEWVIENQPVNTLTQDGESWLRKEWEKGLNHYNRLPTKTTIENSNLRLTKLKPYTTYSVFVYSSENFDYATCHWLIRNEAVPVTILDGILPNKAYAFTTGADVSNINIQRWGTPPNPLKEAEIMITEGERLYPFVPYYGGIVRQIELPLFITATDENPAETIGGNWEDKGTTTTSDGTVLHVYRRI